NPKKALVCADYEVIEINGKIAKECVSGEVGELLERNCINCCFLYRACVASEVGGYNEAEFKVEDYDFWLRFGLVGKIGCINEVLYTYRKHNSSLSATQKWGEIYTKTENLLIKYLPLYLEKYPALKLGLGSRLRILLLKNDFKGILELFKDSSRDLRRKIYVFLKDRYLNLGDKNCVQIICSFGLKYRIKIYLVWLKNRWNLK
ncbi:MAG: glycosyltransferase family 2 protein, partial [Helicobacter sp.]|nr:glycosyltransferase family 2 protein [Helicobacter sp.]